MQLKGLVRLFAILLVVICLYQLSYTFFVRSYESDMRAKAESWVKRNYPNENEANKKELTEIRLRHILDSNKATKIGWYGTPYRDAKAHELALGLDLQGGMSVTMEVSMDELIRTLANNTTDATFNKALNAAIAKKANGGANLIDLFVQEYKAANAGAKLATFFVSKSNENDKIKVTSTDDEIAAYLNRNAETAFNKATEIISRRIDKFGVSSNSIDADKQKKVINIELAGVREPERVRSILQSTANLQFFEVYRLPDVFEQLKAADKALEDYQIKGVTSVDSSKAIDSSKTKTDDTSKTATAKAAIDSSKLNPLFRIMQLASPQQDQKTGKVDIYSNLAYVRVIDTAKVNSYLNLDVVRVKFPANLKFIYGKLERDDKGKDLDFLSLYAIKTLDNEQAELEGDKITHASLQAGQTGSYEVEMDMNAEGASIWSSMTTRNAPEHKPIAVVLDNTVYSAPNIQNPITDGRSRITGNFSAKAASDLAQILESGKLPAPAKIVQEQLVGPTLGAEAIKGGTMSFLISFAVIFILMLIYYNTAGWVANAALILNLLFTVGVLSAINFTLTAAGIAGLVLTIGMAVDTNVIIFERIKEELIGGKSYALAVNDGYKRSLAPVLDAHVTSFLTAAILFAFGLGPILGFATTQMIGIALSLFCGILVSRLITEMYADEKKQRHFEYFTAMSKKVFKHASYKFIEYRKVAYAISVVVLVLGVGSYFNGFDQGVEFAGGRSYVVKFDKKITPDEVRDDLKKAFENEPAIVKTVGTGGSELDITTAYKIHKIGDLTKVGEEVELAMFNGLKKHLPANLDFPTFATTKYVESSRMVSPSISSDLKAGALKAGIFAIIIICLYIFLRFRDWRYSVGTIVALLHDVFVTLAVFSFCRKIVPFPLEIDQHFIAAVLTVIGFSMNDTVIVYDRIREDSRLYPNLSKEEVINKAINQTLSRTIMTSLTVFLTILILFAFGGEVTKGFAFAMLVGVITGTYSSIFVAAPILVDFAKSKPLGKSNSATAAK